MIEFRHFSGYEIEDFLDAVDDSFGVNLKNQDLSHISNIEQFADYLIDKLGGDVGGCTSQQAFYKVRDGIAEITNLDKAEITPQSRLKEILKVHSRKKINFLEKKFGRNLAIYGLNDTVLSILWALVFFMFIGLFISWKHSLIGFSVLIPLFFIAERVASEFKVETVGQLAVKLSEMDYAASRRNPNTVNRLEVHDILIGIMSEVLSCNRSELIAKYAL